MENIHPPRAIIIVIVSCLLIRAFSFLYNATNPPKCFRVYPRLVSLKQRWSLKSETVNSSLHKKSRIDSFIIRSPFTSLIYISSFISPENRTLSISSGVYVNSIFKQLRDIVLSATSRRDLFIDLIELAISLISLVVSITKIGRHIIILFPE